MKRFGRMAYVNIIDKAYEALNGNDVTYENIKASFEEEKDFHTMRMFLSIYVKGVFKAYYDEHNPEHIKKVMDFRKAFYLHDPTIQENEYEELMEYYESIEDYESCINIKNSKVLA